jgi:DNA-binding NtrC family response regulator
MAVILVVEDEAQILILATSYLEEQGHMTLTAGTLEQALALIDSDNEIHVLFTDRPYGRSTGGSRIGQAGGGVATRA